MSALQWFQLIGAAAGIGALIWNTSRAFWDFLYKDRPSVMLVPAPQGRGVRLRILNPIAEDILVFFIDIVPHYLTTAMVDNPRDAIASIISMESESPYQRPYIVHAKGHLDLALVRSNKCPDSGTVKLTLRWRLTTETRKPLLATRKRISLDTVDKVYSVSQRETDPESEFS